MVNRLKYKLQNLKADRIILSILKYVFIICIIYIILFPMFQKAIDSFKSYDDLMDQTVHYVPKAPSLENYLMTFEAMKMPKTFFNSAILSLLVAVLQVVSCTTIGYGFARFDFPFKKFLYAVAIATLLIPPQTIMTAQFLQFRFFDIFGIITGVTGKPYNAIDTLVPFSLLSVTGFGLKNGLYIYLMTQFFKGVPRELEEAGHVDGASSFKIYTKIMLPIATTMMITVFLFSFSWQWTDTFYTRLFLSSWLTLPTAVSAISSFKNSTLDPAVIRAMFDAATMIILVPIGSIYLFTQNYFIEGLEKSGIVG